MIFRATDDRGCLVVEPERFEDERGLLRAHLGLASSSPSTG